MDHPVIRGEQTDEYFVYLFAKIDNDYRPTPESAPLQQTWNNTV